MIDRTELVGKVEALAVELLRGADICTGETRDALALMMSDAAEGLLALLDTLVSTSGAASYGGEASA